MRFLPHTPADIARMLATIGAPSPAELFSSIPSSIRLEAKLQLPEGRDEQDVTASMVDLAARNERLVSFQGAGAYRHFIPAAVAQLVQRAEFATPYTPYQPEVSQGTLQTCFEFQTYVSLLAGLDVANASLYDGASALAEAVLMALRIGSGRERILVSAGIHPEYRQVVETYLRGYGHGQLQTVPLDKPSGRTDLQALSSRLGPDVAAVCIGYPNFYGVVEDLGAAAELARDAGALTISATSEALALALLKSPGACGADIAVGEGQSLGLAVSYGGPGVGLFASRQRYVRQMPGRLVGETVDEQGRRGYVLTLATREQHIRREKATSNICTNQGLAALAVTIYLGLAGRKGLRSLAGRNTVLAHETARRLEAEAGLQRLHRGPFFNEFLVEMPERAGWFEEAVAGGVVPGVLVGRGASVCSTGPEGLLITVTECNTPGEIDALIHCLNGGRAA